MKKKILFILFALASVESYSQMNILTLPIVPLWKKHKSLLNCLNSHGIKVEELKKYENTFIATSQFLERFDRSGCDPVIFEIYLERLNLFFSMNLKMDSVFSIFSSDVSQNCLNKSSNSSISLA